MSGHEAVTNVTMIANAAVSVERFVKMAANGRVIQAAAAGDDVVGVSQTATTAAAEALAVALPGCKCRLTAGAAIDATAGAVPLTSDGTGRAIPVAAATDRVHAYAITSAANANEVIVALFVKASDRRDA